MKNEIGAARVIFFFFILRLPCWILVIMIPSVAQLTCSILCSIFVFSTCFKFPAAEQFLFFYISPATEFLLFFLSLAFPRFCSSSVTRLGSFQTKLGCIWAVFLPLMLVLLFDTSHFHSWLLLDVSHLLARIIYFCGVDVILVVLSSLTKQRFGFLISK